MKAGFEFVVAISKSGDAVVLEWHYGLIRGHDVTRGVRRLLHSLTICVHNDIAGYAMSLNKVQDDLGKKLGIETSIGGLFENLLSVIFDPSSGGLGGFLARMKAEGLGQLLTKFGPSYTSALTVDQANQVIGKRVVENIADRVGIGPELATSALAGLIPAVLGVIAPGGKPLDEHNISRALGEFTGRVPGMSSLGAASGATSGVNFSGPISKWLGWAVLALLPLAIPLTCKSGSVGAESASASNRVQRAIEAPSLRVERIDNGAIVSGKVRELDLPRIERDLGGFFGENVTKADFQGSVGIAESFWTARTDKIFAIIDRPKMVLTITGQQVLLTGPIKDQESSHYMELLRGAFGEGYAIKVLPMDNSVPAPTETTKPITAQSDAGNAALEALGESFTAEQLVKALNLCSIQFESGSARIAPPSKVLLQNAAQAILKAPAGTKIEIGGHTDAQGNAASNLKLSLERANAVRATVEAYGVKRDRLSTKGYGSTRPVAGNDSDAGRKKNRRMEFRLIG